jgi:hypothetical protein
LQEENPSSIRKNPKEFVKRIEMSFKTDVKQKKTHAVQG